MGIGWDTIVKFIKDFGLKDGIFIISFFGLHGWIFIQYRGRLKDRQKEIDRIARDNQLYRDKFIELLDKKYEYVPQFNKEEEIKIHKAITEGERK